MLFVYNFRCEFQYPKFYHFAYKIKIYSMYNNHDSGNGDSGEADKQVTSL
jgi:hypothetical protein